MDTTQPGNPWPMAGGFTGLALFTLVGGMLFVYTASKPPPVAAPKSFASFKATDDSFSCVYPTDWKKRAGGSGGISAMAKFTQGGARIDVSADLAGSLMGDIAKATGGVGVGVGEGMPGMEGASLDRRKPPVESLHEADRKGFEKKYNGYEEQPPKTFTTPAGEGRLSEFTGKGNLLTGKLHGYRATILGGERRINVTCVCPENEWSKLSPAFRRVVGSISAGG